MKLDDMTLEPDFFSSAHVAAYPQPNEHLILRIANLVSAASDGSMEEDTNDYNEGRTELDSHANMCVVGKNVMVLNKPTRFANVQAFSPSIEGLSRVPIVDAAIIYACSFTMQSYTLVIKNALYVDNMDHNLIPPFVMREAGIKVNERPKIHSPDPTIDDHSIYIKDHDLRIPLALWGIFSFFPSRKPTNEEAEDDSAVIMITPDSPDWNPYSDVYAKNEESFLDWQGRLIPK